METSVLIITCEKFKQLWDPFFTLFKKFWSECKYDIYMGTDMGEYPSVNTISLGKDFGWSNNLIRILHKIQSDRIILFLDDFLPSAPFDHKRIEYLVKHSFDYDVGCLRLNPCPQGTAPWEHDDSLEILQPHDRYRFSTQAAIWKKKTLLGLLRPNETPWQTELKGTKRAALSKEHFVSVKRGESPTPYINGAVRHGVWQDDAIDFLEKCGISTEKIIKKIIKI